MVAVELKNGFLALGNAIGDLFKGDFGSMVNNLLLAAVVVGVFLIVMFLMKFVLEISLFRNDEHKKYATWISVGVASIALTNDALMHVVITLFSGSLPIILLVLLAVFAVIIVFKRMSTSNYEASADMHGAHTESIIARKDLKKEDHDLRLQEKMEKREIGAIGKAEKIVDDELQKIHSLQQLITQLRQLLGQLAQVTDQAQAQQLRGSLTRGAQALPSIISLEYADEKQIQELIIALEKELYQDFKLDGEEEANFAHLQSHLTKQLADEQHIGEGEAGNRVLAYEGQLRTFLQQAKQLDLDRRNLLEQLKTINTAELAQASKLRTEVTNLINALQGNNSQMALNALAEIENIVNTESAESVKVRNILQQEQQLASNKLTLDRQLEAVLKELRKTEGREEDKTRAQEHDEAYYLREVTTYAVILKRAGEVGSATHGAAIRNLEGMLKTVKEKFGHDHEYIQKVTNILTKEDVNTFVHWP